MMNPEKFKEYEVFEAYCTAYALGSLADDDQHAFESYLEQAPRERLRQLNGYKAVIDQLPAATEAATPSPDVKRRVMQRISEMKAVKTSTSSEEERDDSSKNLLDRLAGTLRLNEPRFAAAAVLALLIIILSAIPYGLQLKREIQQQKQQLQARSLQMQELQGEVARKEELLKVIGSRDIKVAIMSGEGTTKTRYGKIIWDPVEMKAILQVRNLPALPEDYTYQLWLTRDGKTQSAGTFAISDTSRDHFFKIEKLADRYEAANATFAVTMEPSGGTSKPSGQTFLIGQHQP